jgi:HK97 gp10 family phage protein
MPMSKARFGQLYRKAGGYTRQSSQHPQPSIGNVQFGRGRAEGAGIAYNHFNAIGARLPVILGDIVQETTEAVSAKARANTPVDTGNLRDSQVVKYSKSRSTGAIVSGRIDWIALDPYGGHPDHEYAFFVEVGSHNAKAQPFAVPALVAERPEFNHKLRTIESRL